jgi:hypothetical protein
MLLKQVGPVLVNGIDSAARLVCSALVLFRLTSHPCLVQSVWTGTSDLTEWTAPVAPGNAGPEQPTADEKHVMENYAGIRDTVLGFLCCAQATALNMVIYTSGVHGRFLVPFPTTTQ